MFLTRPLWYHSWCAVTPTPCLTTSVNKLDQLGFMYGSIQADALSSVVQNTAGAVAFILPFILYWKRDLRRAVSEAILLLYFTLWNGVLLELCRALSQRPRPLVFHDPLGEGANINQYTSFYSGHTSFVALAGLAMVCMVIRRFPGNRAYTLSFGMLYVCMSALTGSLRILGGRHYPTDVVAGFLFGSLIALAGNRLYSRMVSQSGRHDILWN